LTEVITERDLLRATVGAHASKVEQFQQELTSLVNLKNDFQRVEGKLREVEKEKASLLDQVGQQERKWTEVVTERDLLRATVAAHATKVEQFQQELTSLVNLKNDFQRVEGKLREVEKEKEEYIDALAVCQERIKGVEDEATQANEENKLLRSQSHEAIESLKARVSEYEIASLQNNEIMKEMQTTISSISLQLATTKNERDKLACAVEVLKGKEKEAEDLVKHSQILEDQLSDATTQQKATFEQLCKRDEMEAQLRADIDSSQRRERCDSKYYASARGRQRRDVGAIRAQ
jgi:chromosome segregation ATPase